MFDLIWKWMRQLSLSIQWAIYRRNTRNCIVSLKSCKISNTTVESLRIHEYYVTTTTSTLMLQNGLLVDLACERRRISGVRFSAPKRNIWGEKRPTERLASPKPWEEMSKEELIVCLKCFYSSARKKGGTEVNQWSSSNSRHCSFRRLITNLNVIEYFKFSKREGWE